MMAALWHDRSPFERRVLGALAAFCVVALVIALGWLPLERTRTRLKAEIPTLRASIAALERQADEVRRLRALPAAAPSPAEPLASLTTAAGAGTPPGAQLSVLDGKTVVLTGADVAFGTLLEWIASAQATQGLRVQAAHIEALPAAGRVRAELKLARP